VNFCTRAIKDRFRSKVAQEKKRNPRLGGEKTIDEFREMMKNLNVSRNRSVLTTQLAEANNAVFAQVIYLRVSRNIASKKQEGS
jgi:hypothetical protein